MRFKFCTFRLNIAAVNVLLCSIVIFWSNCAIASSSPCESLPSEGLVFEEISSPSCLLGAAQGTALYSRDSEGSSSDDDVFDIMLPFPFRWFGTLYDSVFVGSNSYVTFGGSRIVRSGFNAFNPPLPSILIGAADNKMQLLTVARVSRGWLLHYEGSDDMSVDDDVDANGAFLGASNFVWELLFLSDGGLQLCTGMANQDPSTSTVSAVSHQKSPVFARTFSLRANFEYSFRTTCAAVGRVSLSAPIASISGAQLNVALFLSLNATNISTVTITLRGAGFACPRDSVVSVLSSPPSHFAVGTANIVSSDSSNPILVVSGVYGVVNGSTMISLLVQKISTPYQPQLSLSNLSFAVHDLSGRLVQSGNNALLDAILPHLLLKQTPVLELDSPIVKSQQQMLITVTPSPQAIIFRQYAPNALVVTVTGSGWYFDNASVTLTGLSFGWRPISASITALDIKTYRIRIDFDPASAATVSSITPLILSIFPVTTPREIQGSLSDITCAVLNAQDSIIAAGSRGTMGAIVGSTMGSNAPAVSFFPPLSSIDRAVLDVKMTPVFRSAAYFQLAPSITSPSSGPAIVVTLYGVGIQCSANTPVTFLLPFSGVSATASIDTSVAMQPVLSVTISSGSFASGFPIWFQVGPISTPLFEQQKIGNITAAMFGTYMDASGLVAASVLGTMDRIVGGMGAGMPDIQYAAHNGTGKLLVAFTPSASLPANSRFIVTLRGIGFMCEEPAPVTFHSPAFKASSSAHVDIDPLHSTLVVLVPGIILAGSNVTFTVSSVFASFPSNSTLSNVDAAVVDGEGKVLVASASGSFSAVETVGLTVQDYIRSASNGTILLPSGRFSGSANCNNVINETMPPRALGLGVVISSSGSGTLIDCSSTTMRCLVVYRSSITIKSVTFRGGSSVAFVPSATVRSVTAIFNTIHESAPKYQSIAPTTSTASSSNEIRRKSSDLLPETKKSKTLIIGESARIPQHKRNTKRLRASRRILSLRVSDYFHRKHVSGKRRQLLQTSSSVFGMFHPDEHECGGCVFVDAADYNISLADVSFVGCSSVYGGGGFFNVSSFTAAGGHASNNVARQGGGLFVMSSMGSSIQSFGFVNNTVVTFLPSMYEKSAQSSLGKFSLLPDKSAAAGGGAWFQLLNHADNCTFLDNIALAASYLDTSWASDSMKGAHALGSGMFVLETRALGTRFPLLANLVFKRSRQLCAGWCVAGGNLFLGRINSGSTMSNFVFEGAVSTATSSEASLPLCEIGCIGPSVALGSCVVIVDMPSDHGSTIRDVFAKSISSQAVGSVCGGFMTFLQSFSNSVASNISVSGAIIISLGSTQNSIYGLFAANTLINTTLSRFASEHVTMKCIRDPYLKSVFNVGGIYGGVLYSLNSVNLFISQVHAKDTTLQSASLIRGGVISLINARDSAITETSAINCSFAITNPDVHQKRYDIKGGVFYLEKISNIRISNTSTFDVRLFCLNTADMSLQLYCNSLGGIVYAESARNSTFSAFFVQKLELHCQSLGCASSGGVLYFEISYNTTVSELTAIASYLSCAGSACIVEGSLVYFNTAEYTSIFGISAVNASLSCYGAGCHCSGGLFYVLRMIKSPSTPQTSATCHNTRNLLSGIQSMGLSVACTGQNCFILGGIAYFEEVFCLTVTNVEASYSTVSAVGSNSIAAGAIFGIGGSNCSLFSGIRSSRSQISSDGYLSQALGGAVAVLSGNVSMTDCTFSQSSVRCSGEGCSAMGGFVSAISTLIHNSMYNNLLSIDSSSFTFGTAACFGYGCSASGGAVAAGTSYRASNWMRNSNPSLSNSIPPQMRLFLRGCMFANNSASSMSASASAKGGALAVQSSVTTVSDSTFAENFISSGNLTAFAGGGAVYAALAGCILTAENCTFFLNNASSAGQGGAILASFGSMFVGSNLAISRNYAAKGGGILVDAAEVEISHSEMQRNSAWSSGGGLFCSSNQANDFYASRGLVGITGKSTITLKNVRILGNSLGDPLAQGVGADLFVIGSVFFAADSASEISMDGNFDRDVTATVVSVTTNSPNISFKVACRSGTMLRVAPTSMSNLVSLSSPPSMASMSASKCFPACSEVPSYETYRATSGLLASCTPCPRGTYSFGNSNVTSDTAATYCRACPFGAVCRGGDAVISQNMHWGWKDSEITVASRFQILRRGYGCTNCSSMTSCDGHRDGILCGGCEAGFSLALFQTECVPSIQCGIWKVGVVVESEMLAKQFELIIEKETALRNVPIFDQLEADQIRRISQIIVEEEFAPDATVLSQGLAADHMFIIREGIFDVFIKPAEGIERKVTELRAPQYFGELSFLGKAPCSATVRAATKCQVWKIDRSCTDDIDDATVRLFIAKRSREYSGGAQTKRKALLKKTSLYESFDVLLWFYQLAGIMLTMSSPLDYLDGSSVAYSIVSFVLNTRPSTDSVATMHSSASGDSSLSFEALSNKFAFCFFKDSNAVHFFAATFLYYMCWALIISFLSVRGSWLHVRRLLVFLFRSFVLPLRNFERARNYISVLDERLRSSFEIRGAVLLRWCITCFSALSILMLQGTQCVRLPGIDAPGGPLRWLYDGRVACFSNEGEVSGTWQFGSAVGVVVSIVSPALLMIIMMRANAMDPDIRSELHSISLAAYSGPYVEGAFHWTIVMFYERVTMIFVTIYLAEFPFWQGFAVFCWCLIILLLHFTYRPYKNSFRQLLAGVCVTSLMALCALLLRTQSLLSSSRSANFDPADPSNDSRALSEDLEGVIVLALICLVFPLVFTFMLYIFFNNESLQEKWDNFKAKAGQIQLFSPKQKQLPPVTIITESSHATRGFHSQASVSRSVSPLSLPDRASHFASLSTFRRPAARDPLSIEISMHSPPAAVSRVPNGAIIAPPPPRRATGSAAQYSPPANAARSRVQPAGSVPAAGASNHSKQWAAVRPCVPPPKSRAVAGNSSGKDIQLTLA